MILDNTNWNTAPRFTAGRAVKNIGIVKNTNNLYIFYFTHILSILEKCTAINLVQNDYMSLKRLISSMTPSMTSRDTLFLVCDIIEKSYSEVNMAEFSLADIGRKLLEFKVRSKRSGLP